MTDLSPGATKVYDALKRLGATTQDSLKTSDDAMRASKLPKGMVNNALIELVNKGYAKRVAREKAAGYYVVK
ncbi:MAG: transcriptional regulator [Candidatus Hadarchaeota archaeon]